MKFAIIGTLGVGKSTLFELLTGSKGKGKGYFSGHGVGYFKDPRVDVLKEIVEHERVVYPSFEFYDFDGFGKMWKEERSGEILQALSGFDLLVHTVSQLSGEDLVEDFERTHSRLLLSDFVHAEDVLKRVEKEVRGGKRDRRELELLLKVHSHLEEEKPLFTLELREDELKLLRGYGFLTLMKRVIVINSTDGDNEDDIKRRLMELGYPFLTSNLHLELEIENFPEDEMRRELMESYGIREPFSNRFYRVAYEALGLITFYTTAKGEIRAWPIKRGTNAKEAAGKIHTDMERGFIRAEVLKVEELVELGSLEKAKSAGRVRTEGKEYKVEDGDILYIRFS